MKGEDETVRQNEKHANELIITKLFPNTNNSHNT